MYHFLYLYIAEPIDLIVVSDAIKPNAAINPILLEDKTKDSVASFLR